MSDEVLELNKTQVEINGQMSEIYRDIAPAVVSMSQVYPTSKASPEFKITCDPETGKPRVQLVRLVFTIDE